MTRMTLVPDLPKGGEDSSDRLSKEEARARQEGYRAIKDLANASAVESAEDLVAGEIHRLDRDDGEEFETEALWAAIAFLLKVKAGCKKLAEEEGTDEERGDEDEG